MNQTGFISCPNCGEDMVIRVGQGWNNRVLFFCKCGLNIDI